MHVRPVMIAALLVASLAASGGVAAAEATVNDRLDNRPFAAGSRAESYVGLTMTQLLVALGLRLKGLPPEEIRDRLETMRTGRAADSEPPPAVAVVPHPPPGP